MPKLADRRPAVRRWLAATLASTALLAGLPAATARAEGWIDGPEFDVSGFNAGIGFDGALDGSSTAAWVAVDGVGGGPGELAVQRATPDGAVGAVRVLGQAASRAPVVATGPSGASAVAWVRDGGSERLWLALLRADGTPGPPMLLEPDLRGERFTVAVAVDGDGDATVAWLGWDAAVADVVLKARRVAADGTPGPVTVLGPIGTDAAPQVAVAPGGVAWVAWQEGGGADTVARVARFGADGQLDGTVEQAPSNGAVLAPRVDASAAGGALGWNERVPSGEMRLAGVRLPLSGPVLGTPFAGDPVPMGFPAPAALAIAPDGTVTIAWAKLEGAGGAFPTGSVFFSRFAPDATTAPARQLAASPAGAVTVLPLLATAPDGQVLATWLQVRRSLVASVSARRIAADGALGPITSTGATFAFVSDSLAIDELLRVFPRPGGDALLGLLTRSDAGGSLTTRRLDATAPQVTATIPQTATAGVPVSFSATASDRAGVSVWWEFGDDTGSRRASATHVYARPGTYTVTLTATDGVDNETTVTRQVTVTAPAPGPQPRPAPRSGRSAAALKLTKAARTGKKVTVAGTISTRATGKVTIAYRQKIGRKTVTTKTTAPIAKGRWSATLRLSGSLARARGGKATVFVSYAGNATTREASAKRTVTVPRRGAKRR